MFDLPTVTKIHLKLSHETNLIKKFMYKMTFYFRICLLTIASDLNRNSFVKMTHDHKVSDIISIWAYYRLANHIS